MGNRARCSSGADVARAKLYKFSGVDVDRRIAKVDSRCTLC